jgi:aminopeptidase N
MACINFNFNLFIPSLPNQVMRVFKPTPLLPTYLIAFVISKFDSQTRFNKGIEFRTFAREGQIQNTDFGIETAIKALDEFEKAFDLKYQDMEKLDQVALPRFNFGGMENHGIVFYREDFLLYDEKVHTAYDREYVAQTIAHEVCEIIFNFLNKRIKFIRFAINFLEIS